MTKGDKTRQRIVAEAAALFNQHGFEGCSMAELMAATGLEKGGLYRHFSSKEEIAKEAFDHAWRSAYELRISGLDAIPNSVDKLKQFIANFVERRSPVAGGCPVFNAAIESDDGSPMLRERARKALQQWFELLESIVTDGVRSNEIHRNVNAKKLAILIISSLEGALTISRLEKNKAALLAVRSHLDEYLETAVRVSIRRE